MGPIERRPLNELLEFRCGEGMVVHAWKETREAQTPTKPTILEIG
jgi:hypothetical protein